MVKVIMLFFLTVMVLLKWHGYCNCLVVNTLGVHARGNPVPGRPPGYVFHSSSHRRRLFNDVDSDFLTSDGCDMQGDVEDPIEESLNITIKHKLFKTDVIVAGIVYQVVIERIKQGPAIINFTIKSMCGELPTGHFILSKQQRNDNCDSHVFLSQLISSPLTVNWTIANKNGLRKNNLTFEINYRIEGSSSLFGLTYPIPTRKDCQLHLKNDAASSLSSADVPHINDCQVWFPAFGVGHSLVLELARLNVPCSRGYINFSGLNTTQHQYFRSHGQTHLCGKLEEISETDRHMYFPFTHTPPVMHLHGSPVFAVSYHLVDYCYNITFLGRNGSFELKSTQELQCTFKIYLPYGNRVSLNLHIGNNATNVTQSSFLQNTEEQQDKCNGLLTQIYDDDNVWSHCARTGDSKRHIKMISKTNKITIHVNARGAESGSLGLSLVYRSDPMDDIVGTCDFGWVVLKQFCVTALEEAKLPWSQAEMECVRRGGHLASIRNEDAQNAINNLLVNSPGYRDHNAYWIGASDKTYEGDFRWSDGLPFSYTNWFPGWSQHGHYNKQPNDDGLSDQDCVEVRRTYSLPTAASNLVDNFMWNDRDCSTPNYLICERLQTDEPLDETYPSDCNKTIELSRQHPRASVYSPGFPRQYPDDADCHTDITAPPGYRLVLDFEELVLENETSCSYDYLEIGENQNMSTSLGNSSSSKRLCGDWSSKLKLLRYVSTGSRLKLHFNSDYSHHFGGYKARVSMENAMQCADDRLLMFNNSCYLFVSYPEVTWLTAQQICRGKQGQLASILSSAEERFVTANIRKSTEYRTSALYWLGAKTDSSGFKWLDGNTIEYTGWMPEVKPATEITKDEDTKCLSIQWMPTSSPRYPSGLYWQLHKCGSIGGYVCKRPNQLSGISINFSKVVNGTEGKLTTPRFPENYYNFLDFSVKIIGPDRTRLVMKFLKLDIEPQLECLYDYVELKSLRKDDSVKLCGVHDTDMHRFTFVSQNNEAQLNFHSDYSISGNGFSLVWQAVDVGACPMQTLTAKEGILTSPNYPDFLLNHLDCIYTILAPIRKRIWLEFLEYDLINFDDIKNDETTLELSLSKHSISFKPYEIQELLTEGIYVSHEEKLKIKLHTGKFTFGRGFRAIYKIISDASEEKIVRLKRDSSGPILHLNYPDNPPRHMDFLQHFIAPLGHTVTVELFHVRLSEKGCSSDGVIEIYDNYYYSNETWKLCYRPDEMEGSVVPVAPISITSLFNTLHLRQKSENIGIFLNGSLRVQVDSEFKAKLLKYRDDEVRTCGPNPCQNEGKCIEKGAKKFCQCIGHFTGIFCALTKCELEPCVFGTCELTNSSYKCHCRLGYLGTNCELKRRPCEGNPCENRGVCIERGEGFHCRCHAWWEGTRCEKRMLHIPYKPLSERMFHEPFWLGLMTVFVVMAVIGLIWCAKRHFPEKIEKLLAEENDRSRSTMSSLRSSSVREQLAVASGTAPLIVAPSPGGPMGAPRSLFGRLGIRKPSILSLTSPHVSGYVPATARTFSLDDLLKPPQRRSPSPKKKRNNSTPTKKNAAEKKQILQQLVSPGNKQMSRKVSLSELMQMSERKLKENRDKQDSPSVKETKFSIDDGPISVFNDPKLEKKVTFARLLNKVSAEMSSSSEIELGILHSSRLGCVFARSSSSPPSPNVDARSRSPNSTSSNQDLLNNRRGGTSRPLNGKQKPASADSILAMFKNFSSTSNLPSSLKISPCSTPTASTPQDDNDSCSSSIHTPVSFSSGGGGPFESPILQRQNAESTIEVPVLDPLSAHKSSSNGSNFLHPPTILLEIPSTINKCLSPIRELPTPLPTPLPSPALTPIMRRSAASSVTDIDASDEKISLELPNISISDDEDDDVEHRLQDFVIDPPPAREETSMDRRAKAAAMLHKTKNRPPPLGHISDQSQKSTAQQHPLVIPTLIIQTPSPTHIKPPALLFGSPPPQRLHDHCLQSSSSKPKYNEMDKPNSLDLSCPTPLITITCNRSETESDAESVSYVPKSGHPVAGGMSYLSPFAIGSRDHTASESNLSSSGYSSMASPGPSRCGSNNPLCPSESEDPPGTSHSRRSSPLLKTSNCGNIKEDQRRRGRSDSETLSDDPLIESNDEGIETDHLDEKIEEGDVKSAKELEVFIGETLLDLPNPIASIEDTMERLLPPPATFKKQFQLPSIVVNCEQICDKHLSPMSSRSESPLSDRTTGLGRFSPQFYGRHKDILPFTDSDGLYDFPSSDKVNIMTHKKTSRKRDKKFLRNCKTLSPTKSQFSFNLHVPTKDAQFKVPPPRKLSPKRKTTRPQALNSSSSSDSVTSPNIRLTSSSPSPDTMRYSSTNWLEEHCRKSRSREDLVDDVFDDASSAMLSKSCDIPKHNKISKLRAISHQIRFLRRLELSLKRRERTVSHSDSTDTEDDSPRATSPLLQQSGKANIRKSNSIGKLQNQASGSSSSKSRSKIKYKQSEFPQRDKAMWKKSVLTGSGYSD